MAALPLHAQEKLDLKGTACVPVRSVSEESLAFQHGEKMEFVLHYQWGTINTDVATATVELDSLTYNGEKAFRCSAYGKTSRMFDLFFKVREDFDSWFTRDGLKPLKFTRDTYEGGYEARTSSYKPGVSEAIVECSKEILKHFLKAKPVAKDIKT